MNYNFVNQVLIYMFAFIFCIAAGSAFGIALKVAIRTGLSFISNVRQDRSMKRQDAEDRAMALERARRQTATHREDTIVGRMTTRMITYMTDNTALFNTLANDTARLDFLGLKEQSANAPKVDFTLFNRAYRSALNTHAERHMKTSQVLDAPSK